MDIESVIIKIKSRFRWIRFDLHLVSRKINAKFIKEIELKCSP